MTSTPAPAPYEVVRAGYGTAVIRVWTDDKDLARAAAKDFAETTPRYSIFGNHRVTRVSVMASTYFTLGYEGPATSVSINFWK